MRIFLLLCLLLPLLAQHEAADASKKKNPAIGNPQAIDAGRKLFGASCAGCHGPAGQGGRGPNLRQRTQWHPLTDDDLYTIIQKGLPDMPPANLPEAQAWQVAAFVRWLTAPAYEAPPPGNVSAGQALFSGKGECSRCHRVLGQGGMLGPDLTNIGAQRPVEQIREAILDPDADGFFGYEGVTAVLASGRTVRGVARNRTNYSVQIQDGQGQLHLLSMADVKELTLSRHSPMPRDYAKRLTRDELNDLIAYLSRLSVRPYEPPTEKK
jgi:cytochrome c oxidase cbb3-type subunit III